MSPNNVYRCRQPKRDQGGAPGDGRRERERERRRRRSTRVPPDDTRDYVRTLERFVARATVETARVRHDDERSAGDVDASRGAFGGAKRGEIVARGARGERQRRH